MTFDEPSPVDDCRFSSLFLFNAAATAAFYTLSLHDALPISRFRRIRGRGGFLPAVQGYRECHADGRRHEVQPHLPALRSEEHTSELQSHHDLVCRLLLEKKKNTNTAPRSQATQPLRRLIASD